MKIIICDNDRYWIDRFIEAIKRWAYERAVCVDLIVHTDVSQTREFISSNYAADLLFVDVQFARHPDSIEVNQSIIRKKAQTVFTTAQAYMMDPEYFADALGFLVKPFCYENLTFYLDKIKKQKDEQLPGYLIIRDGCVVRHISCSQIVYVESVSHDILIRTENDAVYRKRSSLFSALEELEKYNFLRIHRSFLVSINRIISIKASYPFEAELKVTDSKRIKLNIGRTYIKHTQEAYADAIKCANTLSWI